MSAPVLRSAMNVVRRSNQFRSTSLTAADIHSRSMTSLNVYSPRNDENSGYMKRLLHTTNLDVRSLVMPKHPSTGNQPTLTDMLVNISGNPVLIATDHTCYAPRGEFISNNDRSGVTSLVDMAASKLEELSVWLISTLKRRKKMMNKHKLRKRKKKMRLKTRK